MKKNYFITVLALSLSTPYFAQVGIGTPDPDQSAILHLQSGNKGFLPPRINLTSSTLQLGATPNAEALVIYNNGTTFPRGLYYWDGAKWLNMEGYEPVIPKMNQLLCNDARLSPPTFIAGSNYQGVLTIPYTGGNGGNYSSGTAINSTGVTGLKAALNPGKLQIGNGELVYSVSGIPSASSPNKAVFAIPDVFEATGCSAMVGEGNKFAVGETKSFSYSAPMNVFSANGPGLRRMNGKAVNNVTTTNRRLLTNAAGLNSNSPGVLFINGLMMNFMYDSNGLINPVMLNTTANPINYSITSLTTYGSYSTGIKTTIAGNAVSFHVDNNDQLLFNDDDQSEFCVSQIMFENGEWYQVTWTANQINNIAYGYLTAQRLR